MLPPEADSGFALSATPGLLLGMDTHASSGARFYFQEGYAKWVKNKFEVTLGRLSPRFGDTRHGELILSGAARPMDVFKLSVRPHWIKGLEDFGPFTVESFVTLDGNESGVKGARLVGFQIGLRPLTFLELGLLRLEQFGGENGPGLFSSESQSSWAWQGQLWGPNHAFKVYNQLFFSSLGSVANWFRQDVSYLWGLWIPKLPFGDVRMEYVRTQESAYSHPFYSQGWSMADSPLGHPLGSAAEGLYLDLGFAPIASVRPRLGLNLESRNKRFETGLARVSNGI